MSLCIFCNNPIPANRIHPNWPNHKPKYCSIKCIKRAYYIRGKAYKVSYFTDKNRWVTTKSGKGYYWEKFASNILKSSIHMPFGNYHDLLWNGYKVDVKSANLYKRIRKRGKPVDINKQGGWWRFDRGVGQKDIDYFFCIGLLNNIPQSIYLVPNKDFNKRGVTISPRKSKYDKFKVSI